MVNMFLKSWRDPGMAEWYINWNMMNEGFVYILASSLLIITIVRHAKCYRIYYAPILIMIAWWMATFVIPTRSNSPLMALLLIAPVVALRSRLRSVAASLCVLGMGVAIWRFEWLIYKFKMRPVMWSQVPITITGKGFTHDLGSIKGWFWSASPDNIVTRGWCFIHNDYLEFTRSYGLIGLVLVLWFAFTVLYRSKVSIASYLCMSAALLCMWQRTIYSPIQAGIILVIIALTILENGSAPSEDASHPNKEEVYNGQARQEDFEYLGTGRSRC
jgi:hypothetical protein